MIGQFWRDVVNDIYDSISFLFLMLGRYVRFGCCVIVVPTRLLHSAGSCRNLVQCTFERSSSSSEFQRDDLSK